MKLDAEIRVYDADIDALVRCFRTEHTHMQRSSVALTATKKRAVFAVVAKDPSALRATLHGITKLLTVHEKAMNYGRCTRKN